MKLKYIILIYVLCEHFFSIIGASLSKPHTSRESGLLADVFFSCRDHPDSGRGVMAIVGIATDYYTFKHSPVFGIYSFLRWSSV